MRRIAYVCLAAVIISALASPVAAQQKPKDPALYSEMQGQFGRVTEALNQILARLTAIETEVNRLKQMENELRNMQAAQRGTDQKVSELSTSATRDLIDVKRDMTQLRSDVVSMGSEMRRGLTAQAPPQQANPAPQTPLPEGYITEVGEAEVTINLGSNAGVREGMRFAVFKAGDATKTQIGTISIKSILDANASKAEITFKRPDVKFEFSDGIRPLV